MGAFQGWLRRVIAGVLRLRVVRAALLFSGQNGAVLAAAITYRALFSVFAAVLLVFSVAAVVLSGRSDLFQALIDSVNSTIPGLIGENGVIEPESLTQPAGFTVAGVISLVALLWAAIGAIGNLRLGIRTIAGTVHDAASPVKLILRDLLFAVCVGGLLLASAVVSFLGTAFVRTILGWLGLSEGGWAEVLTRVVAVLTIFALDTVVIVLLFLLLSGVKPSARSLWGGAVIGGLGLTVLQQLSGLFVGGADSNPLLATFASLIALLLWFNLSAQVILIAAAYIVIGVEEESDRVAERYGSATFAQRRVRTAERDVRLAVAALDVARQTEEAERERLAEAIPAEVGDPGAVPDPAASAGRPRD